ncbi:MAG: tRNA guanosine(34) transglycosylase Tgt [Candidatus Staskawiczbacteria bacterium]|nr:tRNA guanosine(34) transglycosylase Tgt [Candidatus Staskawiczbacteria bacterium]
MNFKILKKSKKSNARLGLIETSHGVVETPCLVPVATQAVVKTLDSKEVQETNSQILISNTFHLHLKPSEKFVEKAGGLHEFMNWKKPLMTDSGGFQVFSLGFGRDFGTGKILKAQSGQSIKRGNNPKSVKITEDGVYFNSPIDGKKLFIGPKESIKIQEKLGADIIFAFDECTSPIADYEYTKKSLEKTHRWAKICLKEKKTKQSLFGIVQGGKFKDLRIESAKFIGGLNFDGFGIGGEFGDNKKEMPKMLNWVISELPEKKPRHLLGIGHLEDIEKIIKAGVDTFDCTVPTHYARRGILFGSEGKINLKQSKYLKKREPLDKGCVCNVCLNYRKDYVCHLLKAGELTALKLITFHNLHYFNGYVEDIRSKIKKGEI